MELLWETPSDELSVGLASVLERVSREETNATTSGSMAAWCAEMVARRRRVERDSKLSSTGEAVRVIGSNEERDLCRPGGRGMTGAVGSEGFIGYGRIEGRQEALRELGTWRSLERPHSSQGLQCRRREYSASGRLFATRRESMRSIPGLNVYILSSPYHTRFQKIRLSRHRTAIINAAATRDVAPL